MIVIHRFFRLNFFELLFFEVLCRLFFIGFVFGLIVLMCVDSFLGFLGVAFIFW